MTRRRAEALSGLPERGAQALGQLAAPWQGRLSGHRVIAGVAAERPEDVQRLVELARAGEYRAVIDASMPLSRIAEAHARVDSGHKRGSVVVTVEGDA